MEVCAYQGACVAVKQASTEPHVRAVSERTSCFFLVCFLPWILFLLDWWSDIVIDVLPSFIPSYVIFVYFYISLFFSSLFLPLSVYFAYFDVSSVFSLYLRFSFSFLSFFLIFLFACLLYAFYYFLLPYIISSLLLCYFYFFFFLQIIVTDVILSPNWRLIEKITWDNHLRSLLVRYLNPIRLALFVDYLYSFMYLLILSNFFSIASNFSDSLNPTLPLDDVFKPLSWYDVPEVSWSNKVCYIKVYVQVGSACVELVSDVPFRFMNVFGAVSTVEWITGVGLSRIL